MARMSDKSINKADFELYTSSKGSILKFYHLIASLPVKILKISNFTVDLYHYMEESSLFILAVF